MQNARNSDLYFIACAAGPVKVGRARDVEKRLSDLQQGCPIPLHIVAIVRGGGHNEQRVHRVLGASHIRGEWFERDAVDRFLAQLRSAQVAA